ncbi:MAG: N-acetylmuramoyl-L-alanine amidase [Bacteroides sp.]|nr:N-acetylmuramoyl-L-alanine amidase [Bacteroides sp.]
MAALEIDSIVIHCSATKVTTDITAHDIDTWHRANGWYRNKQKIRDDPEHYTSIGYHWFVSKDGTLFPCRAENETGCHCVGWNSRAIGICYAGGLDASGKEADTRTPQQKHAIRQLIMEILQRHPGKVRQILGHRDTGAKKACPCFDAIPEYLDLLK